MNSSISVSDNQKWKGRMQRFLADERSGMQIYLVAFAIFLSEETLATTMFQLPGRFYLFCKVLALLLVIAKVLLFDRYKPGGFWIMAFLLAVGGVIYVASGYTEAFMWICMVIGAKGVPFKKILQTYLILSVGIVFLAFCASLLDVIQNLQYTREEGIGLRNSFGIIYTTDFASHIFSIILVSFYLLRDRLRIYHYVIGLALAGLVYYLCYTRLDVGCIVLLIGAFACLNLWRRRHTVSKKYRVQTGANTIWIWCMPFFAALMFVASFLYSKSNWLLNKLDIFTTSRLSYGNQALAIYGITPFGQQVEMVGHGYTVLELREYFFVDCSYLYVTIQYGIIFLLIVLGVYVMCCRKYRKDPYFLVAILVVSINCMIAHHLVELAYSPFALALLAAMPGMTADGKPSMWEQGDG